MAAERKGIRFDAGTWRAQGNAGKGKNVHEESIAEKTDQRVYICSVFSPEAGSIPANVWKPPEDG
jgi:hypothetical protein